jgi:uncharacterized protein (DUF362 family)
MKGETIMDNKINRRQFIAGVGTGILAVGLSGCAKDTTKKSKSTAKATPASDGLEGVAESTPAPKKVAYPNRSQLYVVKGSDPQKLIDKGFEAVGGIEKYVKQGDAVVIKPNFSVVRKPGEGATTNAKMVAAVIKKCLAAGAKEVRVIDFPFMSPISLETSGIQKAAKDAGAKVYNINKESDFKEVDSGGATLGKIKYSKDVLNADVFISMPILKHHYVTGMTCCMKNMMGLVYDRDHFHRTDLDKCIAELNKYHKPNLIIMDAIEGIITNGPAGPGDVKKWNQVIFGDDPLAMDVYGCKVFGVDVEEIGHLQQAMALGLGQYDMNKIDIKEIN